ncbi:MAG: TlpA family protein disulfide reductase [Bacteroidales bacterium]|nr:TlpA family protein disulfide reductase [Bacteroidales bacterium]
MKIRHILAAAALLLIASCTSGKTNFKILVTDAEGTVVNVIDMLSGETIATGSGDEMQLVGKAARNAILAIQKENDDWQTLVFNDGKPIELNISNHGIKASELNEKVTEVDLDLFNRVELINSFMEGMDNLDPAERITKSALVQSYIDEYFNAYKNLLADNRDNLLPVAFMPAIFSYLEDEDLEGQFEPSFAYSKHPYTLKYKQLAEDRRAAEQEEEAAAQKIVGTRFIDIEEADVNGKMHRLSEYVGTGNWVLIDFWASWCGPCRREMPNVVAAYKKYHSKGFDIVGLSFDKEKEPWVKAIADLDMPWHHLSDLQYWQSLAAKTYEIHSIPSSLLVDPEGTIVARDLRGNALGAKLAEIFGE